MDGYPISVKNEFFKNIFYFYFFNILEKFIFNTNWTSISRLKYTKPDQDILHAIFLQLAAVIRVTFTPFLLNFPKMLRDWYRGGGGGGGGKGGKSPPPPLAEVSPPPP